MSSGVYTLKIFTLSSARDCFQYVLYKNTTLSDPIYVIIMTKYPPEYTKLQHLKIFSGSMFDLAFNPHRGLEVKGSNPLLAFRQSKLVWDLVRSNC